MKSSNVGAGTCSSWQFVSTRMCVRTIAIVLLVNEASGRVIAAVEPHHIMPSPVTRDDCVTCEDRVAEMRRSLFSCEQVMVLNRTATSSDVDKLRDEHAQVQQQRRVQQSGIDDQSRALMRLRGEQSSAQQALQDTIRDKTFGLLARTSRGARRVQRATETSTCLWSTAALGYHDGGTMLAPVGSLHAATALDCSRMCCSLFGSCVSYTWREWDGQCDLRSDVSSATWKADTRYTTSTKASTQTSLVSSGDALFIDYWLDCDRRLQAAESEFDACAMRLNTEKERLAKRVEQYAGEVAAEKHDAEVATQEKDLLTRATDQASNEISSLRGNAQTFETAVDKV